jgi:hypothetical protein
MAFRNSTNELLGMVWGRVRWLAMQLEPSTLSPGDRIVSETQRRGGREYRYAYRVRAGGSRRSLGVWGGAEHLAYGRQVESAALQRRLETLMLKIDVLRAEQLQLEADVQHHLRAGRSPQ